MQVLLNWIDIHQEKIAHLILSRPEKANAFSGELILNMQEHINTIAKTPTCRAVLLCAKGKHFSAGADLSWMKKSAEMSYDENIADAQTLLGMFRSFAQLPQPTIGIAHGAAYGGAIGLLAACDIVFAHENSKFCLSELRLGLLPAMIYPFLLRKMRHQHLRRYAITAQVFRAEAAQKADLVDEVFQADTYEQLIFSYLDHLLSCAPEATHDLKKLDNDFCQDHENTASIIATARTRKEGQHGLKSFFAKQSAQWAHTPLATHEPLQEALKTTWT